MKPTKQIKRLFGELYYLEGQDTRQFRWVFKYDRPFKIISSIFGGLCLLAVAMIVWIVMSV